MQAVYLKSVRSPVGGIGKFKLHHYGKNNPKVMDSSRSYEEVDSFTDEEVSSSLCFYFFFLIPFA